ncbi:hypothetical protein [Geopseudomonas aromaticivorans]
MKRFAVPALLLSILTGCASAPNPYTKQPLAQDVYAPAAQSAQLHSLQTQEAQLRRQTMGLQLNIQTRGDVIQIELSDAQAFEPGTNRLTPNALRTLEIVENALKENPASRLVIGVPQGNPVLNQMRANSVLVRMEAAGIAPSRVSAIALNNTDGRSIAALQNAPTRAVIGSRAAMPQTSTTYQRTPLSAYRNNQLGSYQRPMLPYSGGLSANAGQRVLGSALGRGVTSAITRGADAGVNATTSTAAQGVGQILQLGINEAIRDAVTGLSR